MCDNLIITFIKRGFFLGFSNTSCVDSVDSFSKAVVEKAKLDIDNLMKHKHSKEEKKNINM